MKLYRLLGTVGLCFSLLDSQAHAQLQKSSAPVLASTDLKNNVVTATGAATSRTLGALSASELNDATVSAAAIPGSKMGVASGVATLNANSLIPSVQIPFGTGTGTVADGGVLTTTQTTANAAIPSTKIGAASGVASLNSSAVIPSIQIPFGTASGTVADGGVLNTVKTTANAAIPSSQIGAASGVASLNSNSLIPGSQIPFGTASGTVADGGTLATTTTTANAALPTARLGAASGAAQLDGNKLVPYTQIPFGTTTNTVGDGGILATASSKAASALQPAAIGSTVAAYSDSRIVGAAPLASPVFTGTPQLTNDPASGDSSKNIPDTSWVTAAISKVGGTATSVGSGTDLSQGNITPTGMSSAVTAAAIAQLAETAIPTTSGAPTSAQIGAAIASSTASTNTLLSHAQSLALYFLQIAKVDNGVVHVLGLNNAVESMGRTIAARAGDVWNVADHKMDGTVTNDNAGMVEAIAYAKAVPGTHIYFPTGTWPLSGSSQFTYLVPSDTLIEGADEYASDIFFSNDTNSGNVPSGQTCSGNETCQYYLFAADNSNGRPHDIGVRHIRFTGTWGGTSYPVASNTSASAFAASGGGGNMFLFDNVDNVDIEDSIWEHERAFGIFVSGSTDVKVHNDIVRYAQADAIAVWQSSNMSILGNLIEHGNDDCISFHGSDGGDAWTRARSVDIEDNTTLDCSGISGLAAKYTVIAGNHMTGSRGTAIQLGTHGLDNGSQGHSSSFGLIIANNLITDLLNRNAVDGYDGDDSYITINGYSAQAGSYKAIPGQAGVAGMTAAQDPAPEFFADATAANVPVGESHSIYIGHNSMLSFLPDFNGTDTGVNGSGSRFNSWTDFGQGPLVSLKGLLNPSTTAGNMLRGATGININYGNLRDVDIDGNNFFGIGQAMLLQGSAASSMLDFTIRNNRCVNVYQSCFELNNPGKNSIVYEDNYMDMDPYFNHSFRSYPNPGGWQYDNVNVGIRIDAGTGLTILRNQTLNASDDIYGANLSDPKSGVYAADNLVYADLYTHWPYTGLDSFNTNNLGVGLVHSVGTKLVSIYGDPGNPLYGALFSVPIDTAPSVPTTGFWEPGAYVRNSNPASPNETNTPVADGWMRTTLGFYNAPGNDWVARYAAGVTPPTHTSLVQTASTRNASSSTSATVTFTNTVASGDDVLITVVGGNGSNSTFAPTMPASCTELSGPGIPSYPSASGQFYEVWHCPSGITYTVSALDDGAILAGMEIAGYGGADIDAGTVPQNGTALNVPTFGGTSNLRVGVVEWNGAGTTVSVSPSSVTTTNYNSDSDSYHHGFVYTLPSSVGIGNFTATTGATVSTPAYVQIDIASKL